MNEWSLREQSGLLDYLRQCESKNELVRGTKKSPASHLASYLSNAFKLRQKAISLQSGLFDPSNRVGILSIQVKLVEWYWYVIAILI
jgi:hypothetical protein